MSLMEMRQILLNCMVLNFCFLLFWFLMWVFGRKLIYAFHGRWFNLREEQYAIIHYGGMALYKIGIIFFNLVPYVALVLMSKK